MHYELKGNYFNQSFHKTPESGPDRSELFIDRYCPANLKQQLWSLPINFKHVGLVVESSKKGFDTWRKISIKEREEYLKRYQEQVISRKDEIATAIALETGKPLWEAQTEVTAVINKVNVTIEDSGPRISPKHYENILPNTTGHLYFKPLGPTLIIGPFNFPCHLANGQMTSSLLAGNSIIFKPSEKTIYSAQLLIECFHAAGFPDGVINLIQGNGEVAHRILNEKCIKGIYFTGSKEIGLKILESTHKDLSKLVALELGGKNASIIHKDSNIEHCLPELLKACFLTSGQRCISTSLVPIHSSLIDEFVSKFHNLSKKIIVDHPIDHEKAPLMGPLIDQQALDSYLLFMGMAKREGMEEIMRGKQLEKKYPGYYVSPSIHIANDFNKKSHFLTSELFGPNCTFIPYNEIDEAIEIVNSTEYGLAASVFTQSQEVYDLCLRDIACGQVNLNRSTVGASSKLPFGGVKNSGNYRPAAVSTIDSCTYQMASLEINNPETDHSAIIGISE